MLHGCRVKRNALVGIKSVILDGAVIGEDAFVAAGAVVRNGFEVPAGMLAAGVPAKVVRPVGEDDRQWKREATLLYQELARLCLGEPAVRPSRCPRPSPAASAPTSPTSSRCTRRGGSDGTSLAAVPSNARHPRA